MHYTLKTYRDPSNMRNGVVEVVDELTGESFSRDSGFIGKTTECQYAQAWCESCVIADTLNFNAFVCVDMDSLHLGAEEAHRNASERVARLRYPRIGPVPE